MQQEAIGSVWMWAHMELAALDLSNGDSEKNNKCSERQGGWPETGLGSVMK